jgi:hypothetical protein
MSDPLNIRNSPATQNNQVMSLLSNSIDILYFIIDSFIKVPGFNLCSLKFATTTNAQQEQALTLYQNPNGVWFEFVNENLIEIKDEDLIFLLKRAKKQFLIKKKNAAVQKLEAELENELAAVV